MLQKLVVRNYAIIEELSFSPDAHLNIVTGETGAGKSIIIGALSLILGERADTSVLINKEEKCVVEGYFDVANNKAFKEMLQQEDIDQEDVCIIRREISAAGKSRAFVNDMPVTLSVLTKLTSLLVDLHQQFDQIALESDHFQKDVVDALAQNVDLLHHYKAIFRQYKQTAQELAEKKEQQTQWQKEADYKQFLYDELTQANFTAGAVEDAEQQLKQLNHSEKIISVLQSARMILEDGEQPLNSELKRIRQQLQSISDVMMGAEILQQRIFSAYEELKDIASELGDLENKINLDPALMQQLQERVDLGNKLFKKHGVRTTDELLALQQSLSSELQETHHLNDTIARLEKEQEHLFQQLKQEAEKLSASRKKTAPQISARINELLKLVGMPNAKLTIEILPKEQPDSTGWDDVQFLLDANKSGKFLPVHKAASGGELSRIMLCIKSLTAKAMQLPTLIFDEVDTGISGEAARQVARLLQELSEYHQIICITHQPQVAARGSRHFFVYKEAVGGKKITTHIRLLQDDERILAIARMIGGEQPSEAALQNARELVTA